MKPQYYNKSNLVNKLNKILNEKYSLNIIITPEIDLYKHLDSIEYVAFIMDIEQIFNISFQDYDLMELKIFNINNILDLLNKYNVYDIERFEKINKIKNRING